MRYKDVMQFHSNPDYFLEPIIASGCTELDKLRCFWSARMIRENIPKIQKGWLVLQVMEDWAKELESQPTGKFIADEIRRRINIEG